MTDKTIQKFKETIKQNVVHGASLQIIGGVGQTVIRICASMVLARILVPSDFGLFGMALLAREFIEYMGAIGMGAGIITKENLIDKDLSTCFWVMVFSKVIIFIIAFWGAPVVALFFAEPRLVFIFRAVSFTFLFSIIGTVPLWILQKRMEFTSIVVIRLLAMLFESAIAVILVLTTSLRVEALVIALLIASVFNHLAAWSCSRWVPKLIFSKNSFRYLFRFGINSLGTSMMTYFYENLDYLTVGRLMGASNLGLYEFAYRIPHIILVRVAIPISSVVFPALAIVKNDTPTLVKGYLKATQYIGLIVFPVLGGLAILAPLIIDVLWGAKWLPIVTPLRILCCASAIGCVTRPISSVFLCKDRPDMPFKLSVLSLSFAVLSVPGLAYYFGLNGVAVGMTFSMLPGCYGIFLASKITNTKVSLFFNTLSIPIFVSLSSSIGAYAVQQSLIFLNLSSIVVLIISTFFGVVFYLSVLFILFRETITDITDIINTKLGRT